MPTSGSNCKNAFDDITRRMMLHPKYYELFYQTHSYIFRGDGPLSLDYRFIVAIMAAGRHECCCLIHYLKGEFLSAGGNESWLRGLKALPKKLQNLYELNKILAHKPWLLETAHIKKLIKGEDHWSLSELIHAIILLVQCHALSSFFFACEINEKNQRVHYCSKANVDVDVDSTPSNAETIVHKIREISKNSDISSSTSDADDENKEVDVKTLMKRMKALSRKLNKITPEELCKRFREIEEQSARLMIAPQKNHPALHTDVGIFVDDRDYTYEDFSWRGRQRGQSENQCPSPTAIFRTQDYCWDNQGCSLVNSLANNEVGFLLDDKFKVAYNLTYRTMGEHSGVDTTRFRVAVWNYIQCLFGIKHDDYDYSEVNQMLERKLKTFVKIVVCYPERMSKEACEGVMTDFKDSEKVHLNIILLEARMQAELLYALRTLTRFIT